MQVIENFPFSLAVSSVISIDFYFQVAALSCLCNIVVDYNKRRSVFVQCGGVKLLVQLTTSMEAALRSNALWALRNLVFLSDKAFKESIFRELTPSSLASLVCGNDHILFDTLQDQSC